MRDRAMKYGFAVSAVLALVLAVGCTTSSAGKGTSLMGRYPRTEPGATFLGGKLVLESVDAPEETGGTLRLHIKNVSGKPIENLDASVLFYMPPTGVQSYDTEGVDRRFSVFKGETYTLTIAPPHPSRVKGWQVSIRPGVTVARDSKHAGSKYLGGKLECVGISDALTSMNPTISFTVESHSDTTEYIEYQVVLLKDGKARWHSAWKSLKGGVPAGQRVEITENVDRTDLGSADAILNIRESVL